MRFALILSLLIGIIAVVFAIYNPEETTVNLINYRITSPLALVIIITLLAGVLAGILASVPSIVRRGSEARYLRKRVNELEAGGGTVVERPVATTPTEDRAARTTDATAASGAAETQRLAAETQRMAAEAQQRAAEEKRREAERRGDV